MGEPALRISDCEGGDIEHQLTARKIDIAGIGHRVNRRPGYFQCLGMTRTQPQARRMSRRATRIEGLTHFGSYQFSPRRGLIGGNSASFLSRGAIDFCERGRTLIGWVPMTKKTEPLFATPDDTMTTGLSAG